MTEPVAYAARFAVKSYAGNNMALTDYDPMPMGKAHQGKPMGKVPADYLLWLYDNNRCTKEVRGYIQRNIARLRAQAEKIALAKLDCCGKCEHTYNGVYATYRRLMCDINNRPVQWMKPACDKYIKN